MPQDRYITALHCTAVIYITGSMLSATFRRDPKDYKVQAGGKKLLCPPTAHHNGGGFNVNNSRAEYITVIYRLSHLKWSFEQNRLITLMIKVAINM